MNLPIGALDLLKLPIHDSKETRERVVEVCEKIDELEQKHKRHLELLKDKKKIDLDVMFV